MGGSLALQEAIRLYTIAASYCMISSIPPLKCSVNLAEVNSDSNALLDETMTLCGSKSSILLINEHNRHLGFSESAQALSLVDHFNEDILHGGYKATINNTFTPLSPFCSPRSTVHQLFKTHIFTQTYAVFSISDG